MSEPTTVEDYRFWRLMVTCVAIALVGMCL
jgi:hypothetical protein